jgi:thiol-disulfide isomerase/thioredoxin
MRLHRSPGFALGCVWLAAFLALPARQTGALTPANSRKPAPDFTLTDSKGAVLKLSGHKGRVVLLDFWATWCGGCKVEIPWYMEFQRKYKDSGLSAIGVSLDEDGWKSVKPFLKEKPINYAVVIGNPELAKLYAVDGMPVTLLIDRDGKIAATHVGMVDKDAFESEIKMLLGESATHVAN